MIRKKSGSVVPAKTKRLTVEKTWAIDPLVTEDDIFTCAHHALLGASDQAIKTLRQSLPPVSVAAHKPVSTGAKSGVAWATWHHGKDFYTYWCGDVSAIIHNASLTDTERETVLLHARKAEASGMHAFATGAKLTHQVPHTLEQHIEHIGLIFVRSA